MQKAKLASQIVMLAAIQAGRSMAVPGEDDNILINSINQEPVAPVNMEIIRAEDFEFPLLYETRLYRPTSYFTPAGRDSSQNYQDFVISTNIIPDSNTEPIPISVNYFAPQDEMENIANYAIPAGASDPVPIDRFAENLDTWQVVFHEMLFGNTFDSSRGEYRYTFVMTATLISPTNPPRYYESDIWMPLELVNGKDVFRRAYESIVPVRRPWFLD